MIRPSIYNFKTSVEFLNTSIQYLRMSEEDFSLNHFAKTLDISAPKLREMMKSKKQVSLNIALKLQEVFQMDPFELFYWQVLIKLETSTPQDESIYKSLLINLSPTINHFTSEHNTSEKIYSHWIYMALLSLCNIEGINANSTQIKNLLRFDIDTQKIEDAINFLQSEGLVTISEDGDMTANYNRVTTKSDTPQKAVHNYYRNINTLASEAIQISPAEREFQTFTINIKKDDLALVKNILRETRSKLSKISQGQENDDVYQINLQAFPLTNNKKIIDTNLIHKENDLGLQAKH